MSIEKQTAPMTPMARGLRAAVRGAALVLVKDADVAVTEVIGEDENDVGFRCLGGGKRMNDEERDGNEGSNGFFLAADWT
jgi:hypothetical protein